MPLVDAKCTNCGHPLKVESNMDAVVCEYCGSAFIVEKAIKNYNINNITNVYIGANDSVEVVGNINNNDISANEYFEKAKSYILIKEWKKAIDLLIEARRLEPENGEIEFYQSWYSGKSYIDASYLHRFPNIMRWEKEIINCINSSNELEHYLHIFLCKSSYDLERCKYALSVCDKYFEMQPSLNGLEKIISLFGNKYHGYTWPTNSELELFLQTTAGRNWNPYERYKYKCLTFQKSSDGSFEYKNISAYEIIKYGYTNCVEKNTYDTVVDYFKRWSPNEEIANYIESKYTKPNDFDGMNICPYCHIKYNMFGTCKICNRSKHENNKNINQK